MFNAQRPLNGIGRAEHHRVLTGKLHGIPAEIVLFKASSIIPSKAELKEKRIAINLRGEDDGE